MNQDNTTMKNAQETANTSNGFTDEEKATIKAGPRDLKAEAEEMEEIKEQRNVDNPF